MSKKPESKDRSMDGAQREGELFFFPKHNPPVSIRAASREEAEEILKTKHKEV